MREKRYSASSAPGDTAARRSRYGHAMSHRVVPRSWRQLQSWDQVQRWRRRCGVIVILDDYTPSHFHDPSCQDIRQGHFETKRANKWNNGAYYWVPDGSEAAGYATACANCGGRPGVAGEPAYS
jgi:hypothetical protein